jgi:phosphoserine aminotransferase
MSRPVTVSNYGVIFAGAQKNVGPAGLTIVIVRDDLLPSTVTSPHIPSIMNYRLMAEHDSLYNTPPVFSMYVVALTLKHLIQTYGSDNDEGGSHQSLAKLGDENAKKANLLYRTIDSSQGFYHNPVPQPYRSLMNIVFRIRGGGVGANFDTDLETAFVKEASQRGLLELKGHRSVGGLRASLYNAMTYENVELLCNFMLQFQQQHQQ